MEFFLARSGLRHNICSLDSAWAKKMGSSSAQATRSIDRETDRDRMYGDRDRSKIVFCQNNRSPTDRRSYNSRPDHHYI